MKMVVAGPYFAKRLVLVSQTAQPLRPNTYNQ
ncbi:hypothetical protein bas13_0046 [Escherichia phage LeonhardEuler]|uniref:Uncharacterized protein n=1 Tax=Escherichia phage LeonhardEuler TaxID=2851977 RepID=A0AAE8B7C8_9CAUD|nr:hypothetical protein bas13_0046 [Escherichia phage LeonhardEuler]